ncbi:MAG: ATP-binding protein [Bacteroidota bacterium]
MSKSLNKNFSSIFLVLAIFSILAFYLAQYYHNKNHTRSSESNYLLEHIDIQSIRLAEKEASVKQIIAEFPNNYRNKLDSLFNTGKYFCFVAIQDSVSYWNTNKVDVNAINQLKKDNKVHVANLPSGWYLYISSKKSDFNISILELIKSDYQLNNDLLSPGFSSNFANSSEMNLTLDENNSSHKIYNSSGQFILGTVYNNNDSSVINTSNYLTFILYLLSYIFIVLFLLNKIYNSNLYDKNPITGFGLFIIIIGALRYIEIQTKFPLDLKISTIFTNTIFNIPTAQSEGALITITILLIIISVAAYRFFGNDKINFSPSKLILGYTTLWIIILINIFIVFHTILDQQISFFSEDILHNNTLFLSTIVIIGLNISMYYAFITFLNITTETRVPFSIPFFIVFIGLFIVYIISNIPTPIIATTLALTVVLIILKFFVWKYLTDLFLNHLILLVLLAIVSSVIVSYSYKLKNDTYQKYVGSTLAISNDTIFENRYDIINSKLGQDNNLLQILFNDTIVTDSEIEDYIISNYLNETIKRYDIQITNCGENELIEIQPEREIHDCAEYFNDLIFDLTTPVIDSILYRFNTGTESNYYISSVVLTDPKNSTIKRELFIEFISSHVPEGFGYPELLIDKQSYTLNLTEYSFAIYSNDHLTYKFGDYQYNTFFEFHNYFEFNVFFNYKNYRHYAIQISPENYLIISREITPTTLKIVVFSIIFLLLSIISIILYLIIYARKAFYLFRLNFKARLQTFIISTLTLTFILMGVTTLIYIKDSNRITLEKQLTEKTNSVLIELQHKLSSVSDLKNQDRDVLHQLLRKFSLVFFSDINLYDRSGELIATSRPEIFEKNLLSSYINPQAYNAIFHENELNFITEENIGSLNYYSAYVPINLNNDNAIGIVNLPYFARQTQITKSYYIMLSYLINIYVIIGIIGALIAIIFSRYLTKPLVLLQESIATIRIDKHNEKIQWNKNDEIGLLIREYNFMVDKLEQSADLLKHSERESAWREVARQIAHEIKNPLTPMKLNVQYLEKAYKNNDPDFASKIESISKSLITQIDVLDDVAEMFSDFAKSKSMDLVKVNLKTVIDSSVDLFNSNTKVSITVKYEESDNELITYGFEKELLRVINNILKNAIQSVDKNKVAIINLDIKQHSKYIIVSITDNGKGISEDMRSQIFHPYFTTKTSGTGLGLAIVKNIMNEIGGKVSFESVNHGGTRFILKFPVAK